MTEEIKDEWRLPEIHEFTPECYTPELLEEHLLGANNVIAVLCEEILPDLKKESLELMRHYGYDTEEIIEHIFRSINVWSDVHLEYLFNEVEWANGRILYKMECHEASKHFEDYMNLPSGTR